VGLREKEALAQYGEEGILIGLQRFEETGKGQAMDLKDFFVKVLVQEGNHKILGAHIIGPQASILIQEIITLMYTPAQDSSPITEGMHIHPALSEVVPVCRHIATDIRERYTIGYVPAAEGKAVRHVRVEAVVPGHGKLVIRTRTSYTFPSEREAAKRQ
jgi:hypothetical protein